MQRWNKNKNVFFLAHSGMISDGARHNFDRRGVVLVPGQNIPMERALELAIEVGAEDVQESADEDEQPLLQVRWWHWGMSEYNVRSTWPKPYVSPSSVYLWCGWLEEGAGLTGGIGDADPVCWAGVCSPHPLTSRPEPTGQCFSTNRSPQWLSRRSTSVGQHPCWQLRMTSLMDTYILEYLDLPTVTLCFSGHWCSLKYCHTIIQYWVLLNVPGTISMKVLAFLLVCCITHCVSECFLKLFSSRICHKAFSKFEKKWNSPFYLTNHWW